MLGKVVVVGTLLVSTVQKLSWLKTLSTLSAELSRLKLVLELA